MEKQKTFNIYIPSYKRAEICTTHKHIEYGVYVVRKSEEAAYRAVDLSPCTVLAVEDRLIDNLAKVNEWVIHHTPEDVICILDDDIETFDYRLDVIENIPDRETATAELERFAQLMVDLKVGFGAVDATESIWNYDREISFKGTTGSTRWINKEIYKAKIDEKVMYNYDLDVMLQELLTNRITLKPKYFCSHGHTDTLSGGDSEKKRSDQVTHINNMKAKWGKYFEYDFKHNKPKINVPR